MNTLFIAILSIALSVAAQFSLKTGMSGAQVKEALAQPFTLQTVVAVLTDKFIFGGFLCGLHRRYVAEHPRGCQQDRVEFRPARSSV